MEIPILIEPLEDGGFRARSGEPFGLHAEGETTNEATQRLGQMIAQRLQQGAQLASLSVPSTAPAIGAGFPADGLHKTDWFFRELREAISENRRREDEADR